MESDNKSTLITKTVANSSQKLLKDLIKNVKEIRRGDIKTKQIQPLSDSLRRIFYHGLSLDSCVSSIGRIPSGVDLAIANALN